MNRRNSLTLTIVMVVASIFGLANASAEAPLLTFDSPLWPEYEGGSTVFLPIIMQNFSSYSGTVTPRYGPVCAVDPARGQLYRDWVEFTATFLQPLSEWAAVSCLCGMSTAQAAGAAFGAIAGRMVRIIVEIFNLLLDALGAAVGIIGSLIEMLLSDASPIGIVCTGDIELLCFGIAAIASLDAMASGVITTIVTLVIAILSFYLGMYVVKEVRQIMQPGDND